MPGPWGASGNNKPPSSSRRSLPSICHWNSRDRRTNECLMSRMASPSWKNGMIQSAVARTRATNRPAHVGKSISEPSRLCRREWVLLMHTRLHEPWQLGRLCLESRSRPMGGCWLTLPCGRCQLYQGNQGARHGGKRAGLDGLGFSASSCARFSTPRAACTGPRESTPSERACLRAKDLPGDATAAPADLPGVHEPRAVVTRWPYCWKHSSWLTSKCSSSPTCSRS